MEIPATVTSKGQITIPAPVRKAMGLKSGDRVIFRLLNGRAVIQATDGDDESPSVELERAPDFFALAGSVSVPLDVDPNDWPAQRRAGWAASLRDRV